MSLLFLLLMVAVVFSALCSASETSFISSSDEVLYDMIAKGGKRVQRTVDLLVDKDRIMATALLVNNLCNVLISSLVTVITIQSIGRLSDGAGTEITVATLVATVLIFLFGEVLPKTIALSNAEKIAVAITPAFSFLMAALSPVLWFTNLFNKVLCRVLRINIGGRVYMAPHEEIKSVVQMRHGQGKMVKDDKDMLNAVLELNENDVGGIMCHRNDIFSININDSPEEIASQVSKSSFSRIPFYDGKPDNIIGFLHIKDFFVSLAKVGGDPAKILVRSLLNKPVFVPSKTSLKTQLSDFRKLKTHMVFVVDEYGGVMGLVTFEDLLEEIVGEISDEHDTEHNSVMECADGSIMVDGDYPVRDFNKKFDTDFSDQVANTMAGLILNNFKRIPEEGEVFELNGYTINIHKTDSNKIVKMKLIKLLPVSKRANEG